MKTVQRKATDSSSAMYDKWFVAAIMGLLLIGLMMVSSSSVMIATKNYHQPFYFLVRQTAYLSIGSMLAMVVMRVDTTLWQKHSVALLGICLLCMVLVLIPGIGKMVNGSRRWLALGPIGIQVSELAKFLVVIYISGYLVRQQERNKNQILGFIKPMIVLAIVASLLLMEPDFGATVVIVSTVMMMLFYQALNGCII